MRKPKRPNRVRSSEIVSTAIISQAITEAVCDQFMDWLGESKKAPFGLRADVYARVEKVLRDGVEC